MQAPSTTSWAPLAVSSRERSPEPSRPGGSTPPVWRGTPGVRSSWRARSSWSSASRSPTPACASLSRTTKRSSGYSLSTPTVVPSRAASRDRSRSRRSSAEAEGPAKRPEATMAPDRCLGPQDHAGGRRRWTGQICFRPRRETSQGEGPGAQARAVVARIAAPVQDTLCMVEAALGVLPNSTLTMARRPELMEAFTWLNGVVIAEGPSAASSDSSWRRSSLAPRAAPTARHTLPTLPSSGAPTRASWPPCGSSTSVRCSPRGSGPRCASRGVRESPLERHQGHIARALIPRLGQRTPPRRRLGPRHSAGMVTSPGPMRSDLPRASARRPRRGHRPVTTGSERIRRASCMTTRPCNVSGETPGSGSPCSGAERSPVGPPPAVDPRERSSTGD
jgi:hypothetical protein